MNLAEMLAMADKVTQNIEVASNDFELLPPGNYDVAVTSAEGPIESARTNPNNPAEHGQYIKIECTITGPSHIGRKVWMNNNIIVFAKDSSPDSEKKANMAMAMGGKERKVMLDSIGKSGIQSVVELVGATFTAAIVVEKGTNGYKDKNTIKTIKPLGSVLAAIPTATPTPSIPIVVPTATPTARSKMPWEK